MAELTYDGTELRRSDKSVRFYITTGWVDVPADIRGTDTIVPGLSGRTRRPKVRDTRTVILSGMIMHAEPSGLLAIQEELGDLWRADAAPANLVVTGPYLGLDPGETATLLCATVNVAVADSELAFMRRYSWELVSLDTPPEWVFVGGSS